ncbi:phosphotriesterase-related protein-like isoform X3 [Pomacea canaliculata]|nr:phosphotriesterase-related protein-like isoform X3 [Pomacea canaliculata]
MTERKGKIQTVSGLIDPFLLGITLTHEHLALKAESFLIPPANNVQQQKMQMPFEMKNLGWIRQNPYSHLENLSLQGEDEAIIEEMKEYKALGGQAVVENTTTGLSRDVGFLKLVSDVSGVHIISGTGFYAESFQSESVRQLSEEAMSEVMRQEITNGVENTDIKCGVIGEVGCSWPLTEFEKRSLRASAAVQVELGSPAIIHPGRNSQAPFEIMRIFLEAGGQANRTVMSHLDRTIFNSDELLEFAKFGCYCEYDLFGIETSHYQLQQEKDMPNDANRIAFIRFLVEGGYGDRVVVAHDLHTKHRLKKYGGHGYTHILENVVPKMRQRGFNNDTINKILCDNPRTWLTFHCIICFSVLQLKDK